MKFKLESISNEMAKLTKEERADIYIANREERMENSKQQIKEKHGEGELVTVNEYAEMVGAFCDLGEGASKGNIYRLVHMGDVVSVRMCRRCGGLDVNVRQLGYCRTWESAEAVCMDCGWVLGYENIMIYIKETKIVKDYKAWMASLGDIKRVAV